jgi:hypothetical protein
MACNCKRNKNTATWTYTAPDGKTTSYRSETEAKYAVARKGGTYKKG